MDTSAAEARIQWEDLIHIADLFELSGEKHLSLLGGEPSLHKDFVDMILYLIERRFHITVFTSGIMSEKKLQEAAGSLQDLPEERLHFVCNLNHPRMSKPSEITAIERFLTEFGERSTLSFNIFHLDFEMEYLFDYIERFNLKRHIRLGLAHPIPGQDNLHIGPDDFGKMKDRLLSYIPQFIRHNVSAGFDCGFPLCIFSDSDIGKLVKLEKAGGQRMIKFVCNPAIDIGPDMSVWSCFPLSGFHKRSLYEFNNLGEVRDHFKGFHLETREKRTGVFDMCLNCTYFQNGICAGGCLAHVLKRIDSEAGMDEHSVIHQETETVG
jgi:radical SAM protein with 4Fe4S-binding SPASM domain